MSFPPAALIDFKGRLLTVEHSDYHQARQVWNAAFDKHPVLIAQCVDAADVRAALAYAQQRGLAVAVRGGGHSMLGHSVCDGGVVIDLRRMNAVQVDANLRVATVGGGARWTDVDAVASRYGLAVPGGDTSTVGVAGLALGGGLGWLTRMYGMTCDNVIGAEVVTADGRLLRADADTHPDLFWALRGGGANFGVVTELRFRMHPIPVPLLAGVWAYPFTAADQVLGALDLVSPELPDELSWAATFVKASPVLGSSLGSGLTPTPLSPPALPQDLAGQPMLQIRLCYLGPPGVEANAALALLDRLGKPLADTVAPTSYSALQHATDADSGMRLYSSPASEWLSGLSRDSIQCLRAASSSVTSPQSMWLINQMGGAVSRLDADANAFGYRHAPYVMTVAAGWIDPDEDPTPHHQWSQGVWRDLQADSAGGGYLNTMGTDNPERVRTAYSQQGYTRLAEIKRIYDPGNVFRFNYNIPPAPLGDS